MTAVALIVMLVLFGWGFYLIRNPEQINWRRRLRRGERPTQIQTGEPYNDEPF